MSDRDELIEQAREISARGRRWPYPIESFTPVDLTDTKIAEAFVDADWRPPPSGDVVEQVARVVAEIRRDGTQWFDEREGLMVARELADANLLRTPPQQTDGGE